MVLQTLYGLYDREALDQVRYNLRFKLAIGLELDDLRLSPLGTYLLEEAHQ
jgi:IS5 family transposase